MMGSAVGADSELEYESIFYCCTHASIYDVWSVASTDEEGKEGGMGKATIKWNHLIS